mmetsp:Transcript_15412/g.54881  ORF Transcript_15412/g.54881 Transcript_15412/m.54881 type:complete len:127 (+) Transcript_15412:51-431(+)
MTLLRCALVALMACTASGASDLPCVVKSGKTCDKKSKTSWIRLVTDVRNKFMNEKPEKLAQTMHDANFNEIKVAQQLASGQCKVSYPKCETKPAVKCFKSMLKESDLKKNPKFSYNELKGGNCKAI